MRIIFFGTPLFSAKVLQYLLEKNVEIACVVSKPDRPKGRSQFSVPTPVKEVVLGQKNPIPLHQPEIVSDLNFLPLLSSYQPDLFVVVAYGEIIKQSLLDVPKRASINLHTSLLPKYRGAAPIQQCIIHGETTTGITIMHMTKKMDAGDIIKQVQIPIEPDMTYGQLEDNLCQIGQQALLEVIQQFEKGEPTRTPQDSSLATFAPKIELEDCEIVWNRPATQLHNLIRGVNPEPGAWCYVALKGEKKRMKIFQSKISSLTGLPGQICHSSDKNSNLIIGTQDKGLELIDVQLEGKKRMSSSALIRGLQLSQLTFL